MKGEEQLLEMEIMHHGQSWALVSKLFVGCSSLHKIGTSKYLANIYLFKANDRNIGKRCEVCSKLTIKTPEDVSNAFLVILLTLNIFYSFFYVYIDDFEQVNVGC